MLGADLHVAYFKPSTNSCENHPRYYTYVTPMTKRDRACVQSMQLGWATRSLPRPMPLRGPASGSSRRQLVDDVGVLAGSGGSGRGVNAREIAGNDGLVENDDERRAYDHDAGKLLKHHSPQGKYTTAQSARRAGALLCSRGRLNDTSASVARSCRSCDRRRQSGHARPCPRRA